MPSRRLAKWLVPLALLLLVVVGVFLRGWFTAKRAATVQPVRGEIVQAVYGLGTVMASENYALKVAVPVQIEELYVKEGDLVLEGSPLVRLRSLEHNSFPAPFTGTVTSLNFTERENVRPGEVILVLTNLEKRYVEVIMEQEEALRVAISQTAQLSFAGLPNRVFGGQVSSVYPSEGRFLVKVDVPDLPDSILPGMNADVSVELARKENALLVPRVAVSGNELTILRGGKKRQVRVQTGLTDDEMIEIAAGALLPGDRVVVP